MTAPFSTDTSAAHETSRRLAWLDAAKGIGILLVVAGHALGGIIDSPAGQGLYGFRQVFFAIYAFHMPLFLLLSGLLVTRRLERGAAPFVRGLLPSIVWPYFLWSVVQFSIIHWMGNLVNRPVGEWWPTILSLPWNTVSQFWFLYVLFWLHLLASVLVPRIGRHAFLLLTLAMKAVVLVVAVPVAVKLVASHAFFYGLGVCLGIGGAQDVVLRHGRLVKLLLPACAGLLILASMQAIPDFGDGLDLRTAGSAEIAGIAWRFPAMAAALFGAAAALGIASLSELPGRSLLAWLGRLTMPIFVLHVMFVAGTRIVLLKTGLVTDARLLLPVLVVAGILGPLAVERVTRMLKLNRFAGFG